VKVRPGQSSRTRDKEDLQPDDRWTPSHKYAPTLAPINVNLAATIKFGKREFPSLPVEPTGSKKTAPASYEPDPYTARGVHPPVPPSTYFTSLKAGSTCAISKRCLITRSRCPIRRAIRRSRVAGSSAQRRQASAQRARGPTGLPTSRAPRDRAMRMCCRQRLTRGRQLRRPAINCLCRFRGTIPYEAQECPVQEPRRMP
jgi:hypothetical protein